MDSRHIDIYVPGDCIVLLKMCKCVDKKKLINKVNLKFVLNGNTVTALKFSMKNVCSKYDQIRNYIPKNKKKLRPAVLPQPDV